VGFLDRFRESGRSPDEILDGELLVPTADTGREPGVETLDEDAEIPFIIVTDEYGLDVLPAFTSEQELDRWRPQGSPYVGLNGKDLVEILARSDLDRMIVDGAGRHPLALTRSAAQELVGVLPVPAGSAFRIGQPAEPPPTGLVQALRSACERQPEVREGYLFQLQIVERGEAPSLTVGLLLNESIDEADHERIGRALFDTLDPSDWGYEFLDVHFLSGELLDAARANGVELLRR
jgi:SseB protein N-terminal domain/SseB protein C-terminal domain